MNVLFLSTWYPDPPDNGSKLRAYHLIRALSREHRVTLVAFAFDTARPAPAGPLCEWCAAVETVQLDPFAANRVSTLRTFLSPRPTASRPVPAMTQCVADALRRTTFDAVIASTDMMAGYALMAPPNTLKVLEEHNSMTRWMRGRYDRAEGGLQRARCWASWQKRRRFEARQYPHFDLVTMVSETDRLETLAAVGESRVPVAVVPNGVDCMHNRPGLVQARPGALVYNGALTYSANYDAVQWFLGAIYPHVKQVVPGATFAITGSTAGVNTAGLALDDSVTLTGYVEDIRCPVAGASACVVPLRQGGGTRLKILEAMALGTPVVATSKGAEGLGATDGEHLLLADSPLEFAERTAALLGDEELHRRLAANARRLVEERYDWQQIGAQFVALVEQAGARANVPERKGAGRNA